jgi:5'-3' exonuclease
MKQVTKRKTDSLDYFYTVVLDMNNLMKISSVNHEMNSNGKEYGIVMTALRLIGDILKKKDFNYCIAAYDGIGSGVLRWKFYEDYKANRGKQYELHDPDMSDYDKKIIARRSIMLEAARQKREGSHNRETDDENFERQKYVLQNILEELCIRQYEFENVEGDDIISYYVKHKKDNEKVVIVSSDKDLTQLISDTVIVYNPRMKDFITKDNSVEKIGITHENVVLEKILCGDVSDNIKGVKGIGEQTLIKLFPQIKTEKLNLKAVIERSEELLRERKEAKKKPLKTLENIINGITDGCQGDKLYEINEKIIDLSEPLMTKEAEDELSEVLYAPIDTSDRDMKNVYRIIREKGMNKLSDEEKFGDVFASYSRIMMMEKKRYQEFLKKS